MANLFQRGFQFLPLPPIKMNPNYMQALSLCPDCRYTLLVGKPPFETQSLKDTYQKIKRNEYRIPSYVGRDARSLITRLLQSEPTNRPSPGDILEDPFITGGYLPAKLPNRLGKRDTVEPL